jgi:hypothetical protein
MWGSQFFALAHIPPSPLFSPHIPRWLCENLMNNPFASVAGDLRSSSPLEIGLNLDYLYRVTGTERVF